MNAVKTFDATGLAPNGRLYAGDLNAIQAAAAALTDFAQTLSLGTLRIGETGLQLLKYATAEARLVGALRTDGLLRGLGGIIAGTYSTTQRDAIALSVGLAPYGTIILNTTTNQYEWNKGTDAARDWKPLGVDPVGDLVFDGVGSSINFTEQSASNFIITSRRSGDAVDRIKIREDGRLEIGPGGATATDVSLNRDAVGRLRIGNELNLVGYKIYFGDLAATLFVDGSNSYLRGGTLSIQNADGTVEFGYVGNNFYRFTDGRYSIRAVPQKAFLQSGTLLIAVAGATVHVTFPVAFSAVPIVISDRVGPSGIGHSSNITTTGFDYTGGTGANTTYQWIAIGTL